MNTRRSLPMSRAAACFVLAATEVTLGLMGMSVAELLPPQPCPNPQQNQRVYLECAAPPDTFPVMQPDWDYFAWNSFIALNWPALEVLPDKYRGVPDLSKQFVYAANSDLAVWETFKEKREVFNHPDDAGSLTWYSPIDYGKLRQGGVSVTARVLHQNSGTSTPPNALDETVEVQSQSLETTYPNGKTNPLRTTTPPVVTPRVWRGQPSAKNPIVYEVKLNYDYFKYVVSQGLNCNQVVLECTVVRKAAGGNIHLPVRTSSASLPRNSAQTNSVLNYRANVVYGLFTSINYIYRSGHPKPVPPPPGQGSIQVKAAWIKVGGPNAKPSDFPTWHTAFAVNYISDANGQPVPSEPTLFGLVGMHIIQRVHTTDPKNPGGTAKPTGGTFVFATWEHESIFNSPVVGLKNQPPPTYFYSNFFKGSALEGPQKGFYPPLDQPAYPVMRQYPVLESTKNVTRIFHNAIRAKNPNSVWLHYHLVGTQFQAVDLKPNPDGLATPPNDPTRIGQPVFLANLAIETNLGLQFFKGQPPHIEVIQNFQNNGVPNNKNPVAFARDNANTSFNGKAYNMGGCMGCHGVAQSKGYGFSFVLLDGYAGAVTDTQEHFNQPGANP